ncbi:LOW QUALITY PROTEIN: hypothetical protein PHBOTO_005977 [Pseudozyma hubeiensis]|nr:LOW QUALITY PROTEIN: hypothetical protein PHBOTO_005977 [Pseudozyma hubeiensis]
MSNRDLSRRSRKNNLSQYRAIWLDHGQLKPLDLNPPIESFSCCSYPG